MKKLIEFLFLFPAMILLYAIVSAILFLVLFILGFLIFETIGNPSFPIIGIDIIVIVGLYKMRASNKLKKGLDEFLAQIKWNK